MFVLKEIHKLNNLEAKYIREFGKPELMRCFQAPNKTSFLSLYACGLIYRSKSGLRFQLGVPDE